MSVKVIRDNSYSIFSLKLMYYYAKMFGMVYFSITNSARLKSSVQSQLFSISYRLACLIGYSLFMPQIFSGVQQIPQIHIRAMAFIQFSSAAVLTVVFIAFQVVRHREFISVVNKTIEIFIRISVITRDSKAFGGEFYLLMFGRIATNVVGLLFDVPRLVTAVVEKNFIVLVESILGHILWFGTLIVVDLLCLGYITASGMYRNIGNHMKSFAKRIERFESSPTTKFRRMEMLCDFSEELDECSNIYSEIFKVTGEFHALFQFNILFTFYIDLITIIGNIHHNYLTYLVSGQIMWGVMALGIIRAVDFLFLMLVVDLAVRRSRIPKYINWDCLCSDVDGRWDKSVDHFLNQLRFEDLRINVYGLFQLNNELCLQVFSVVVAYLTILIQFSMLGYFNEYL